MIGSKHAHGIEDSAEAIYRDWLRHEPLATRYAAGESMGGFPQHGLGPCAPFGRMAGRNAAAGA